MKAKLRILLAEDSAHVRLIIKEILIRHGCEVVGEVETGSQAVELYKQLFPDVVILDITMPEMDGIEALKEIKSIDAEAKVIMLGAMGEQNKVIDAIRLGAMDFFIKPIQADRIAETLETLQE